MEKSVDHVPVQNQEPGLAEQLAVLDGVQYFSLDEETISKQRKQLFEFWVATTISHMTNPLFWNSAHTERSHSMDGRKVNFSYVRKARIKIRL